MVDAVHHRFAVGHQARNDQAGRGAQVGGHHRGARQAWHALDHGHLAIDLNLGAQAHQFVDVHEAVFKNRFGHRGRALRNAVERHELRLHVGGETGVFGGAKALGLERSGACALHADTAFDRLHGGTGLAQFFDDGVEVVGTTVAQHHITTRGRHGTQKGAGLDAVGHHAVGATVQPLDALDANAAGAMAFNLCAHGDQHLGQVRNFRLLGGVFQHCLALGQRGSHEEVLGARHGDHVGGDACALQARPSCRQPGDHVAVLDHDLGAHGGHALDVLVHRARTDGATARQRHRGLAKAGQQRAQRQDRGAHGLDQFVGGLGRIERTGVNAHGAIVRSLGRHAHVADELEHGAHILQLGNIQQRHRLGCEECGAQLRQGGVLGARDQHLAMEGASAADQEFVHRKSQKYV